MIWHPQPGQRVLLHYAKRWRGLVADHGQEGNVIIAAPRGPGPINVAVRLDSGRITVVPRGNLVALRPSAVKGNPC